MQLTEKEQSVIKELQTQEKSCVEKYRFYESSAKDPELQKLFHQIGDEEQEHFDSLADVLKGNVPNVKAQESGTQGYTPSVTYDKNCNSEDKNTMLFYVPIPSRQKNLCPPRTTMTCSNLPLQTSANY